VPLTALGARQADGRYRVRVIAPDGQPQDRTISIGLANSSLAEVTNAGGES